MLFALEADGVFIFINGHQLGIENSLLVSILECLMHPALECESMNNPHDYHCANESGEDKFDDATDFVGHDFDLLCVFVARFLCLLATTRQF